MIAFSQNCLHLREQCTKDNWKAKSYAYVFGIGRIIYAVSDILLDTFLNHCISRREAWINCKEHSRGLPRQLEAQSMLCDEKLKELVGQCPTQSGLVLMLAFLPFKVRPDSLQRSLPTYIFLWLGCIFMGMWTMLFYLVHLGFLHSLSPSLPQTRVVLWGTKKDWLQTCSVGHKVEGSLLLFLSGCFAKIQSFTCMFSCLEKRNYAAFFSDYRKNLLLKWHF